MSAEISACGRYRYTLTRPALQRYPERGTAVFCMLNPSTADATVDDPTIRRCRGFAKTWDCAGIAVVNLYALRSTDPRAIAEADDPVGPENDYWLRAVAKECGSVVCAWGANARPERVADVIRIWQAAGADLLCLGTTKDGHPRHPLYVRSDQPMLPWVPR